ncbi:MAG: tetratricopeptide repeat protein [Verrucomicrobiota bacterium]
MSQKPPPVDGGSPIPPPFWDAKAFSVGLTCLLVVVTLAVFGTVSKFKFLKFDDDSYVTGNLKVQRGITPETVCEAFSGTVAGNWHPVTVLSHMLDCALFGVKAGQHHLVNVGFHSINVILLVWLVRRWTGQFLPALLLGAVFALHPLRVESVAWISERKDVLSTMFWFLGLGIYTSWVRRPQWGKYLFLAFCLTLGLLSKAMLVTFPFTLLLLDVWPLRRIGFPKSFLDGEFRRNVWQLVREKLPLFGVTATFCWVALYAQRSAGAVAGFDVLPLTVRIQTAVVAYAGYLGKFFWPVNLACIYPHPGSWPWWMILGSSALLLGITGFSIAVFRTRPWWFFGWFWYLGTLVPVIGLVQIGDQWMADRYTYVPLIGPALALVWDLKLFMITGRARMIAGTAGISAVLVGCISLTSRQLMTWKDTETLSLHAIKTTGGNAAMWTNLAICHAEKGRLEEALREFMYVVRAKPLDPNSPNNVGRVLEEMGRFDEAGGYYLAAVKIDPNYVLARQNLGRLCTIIGRDDLAIPEFEALLRLQADDPTGYFQLARILAASPKSKIRNGARAVMLAERGCKLEPKPTSSGREILASAYSEAGRVNDSALALAEAADLARAAGQTDREKMLRRRLAKIRQIQK